MTPQDFQTVVARANLAPSVHNIQPARWRMIGDTIEIAADLSVGLAVGDPLGQDAGLSCGAATQATLLALGRFGMGADVVDLWPDHDRDSWPGHRMAARLRLSKGELDPLETHLEQRFTWRSSFKVDAAAKVDWATADAFLVTQRDDKAWLADRNDSTSLKIMRGAPFRHELLGWMRLSARHPRYACDGLSREALQMPVRDARLAGLALGPLWRLCDLLGLTQAITAEAAATRSAAAIACFHRPKDESPVTSGRAYLTMWLDATRQGYAGWPMAALSDDVVSRDAVCQRFGIGPERQLVQVIRFGPPAGPPPPRARRPIGELLQ